MRIFILSTAELFSFHRGGKKVSPRWKETFTVVERITVCDDFT
ncbi:hypothetical protein HMPREF2531_01276 [Bacteroides intestinalis]|uniref:Uncharacterized protein n=1 Tax=Bacteroides intestinalis TaxID=329854 RepID=A0A139LQW6_9BACE|nr:hypothetical protein HMPREF2531_01276 [Bacteroides intestinalis]